MLWQVCKHFWEEHTFFNPHLHHKYVGVHRSREFAKCNKPLKYGYYWDPTDRFSALVKSKEQNLVCSHKTALLDDVVGIMAHTCIKSQNITQGLWNF